MSDSSESVPGIAVIGIACRFPGAPNVDAFWQNLKNGVESISFFSERELLDSGIDPALLRHPNYVRAAAVLDGIDQFDAAFFGIHPREAEITDPQQRLFLECAYTALEDAGYNAENYAGLMGVYAGVGPNAYLQQILSQPELVRSLGLFQIGLANEKDFLATRLAYKLNLRGPSASVQTACSTSLVAVHLACQSLLNYEADIMLAGASSIRAVQQAGYLYQDGGIYSRDGHCRAFDADASGSVAGSGVGVVVLKRLTDALADGDSIHAVIRSSAVNNDGALKLGFTTPSQDGQAAVIGEAIALAGIDPETIGYIETHGTGTRLGDSIELAALKQAFRRGTAKQQFCAIGSVKTNLGHLDAAAGIAGLIKTVLALKHQQLPPSLHFTQPNPTIDWPASPFYVNTRLSFWPSDSTPRRAGVSAFGIGGTNAHLLLEEAPPVEPSQPSGAAQLLTLSAQTPSALASMVANLADHLGRHPELDLADIAYTLHVGRRSLAHRVALVCHTTQEAIDGLRRQDAQRLVGAADAERGVVFLFPGQGAQYPGMTRELYATQPSFRRAIDRCAALLIPHGLDLRAILYPAADETTAAATQLSHTAIVQPALFAVEYALAQLWQAWGVVPQALLGHSLGEYVAATLAGVFALEDALPLVALRGRLMQHLPRGSMLAIPLGESELQPLLSAEFTHQLALAAINGPASCVVAGAPDAITALAQRLKDQAIPSQPLPVAQAFHSSLVEPMLEPFLAALKRIPLHPPQIPYISNLTGTWITAAQTTDPNYWVRQLRETVRFGAGIETLCQTRQPICLEVGPGHTLTNLTRQHPARSAEQIVLASLGQPGAEHADTRAILQTLGRLWQAGIAVDWEALHAKARPRRVPLPTYPFERQRYWIAAANPQSTAAPAPQTEHLIPPIHTTAQSASTRHTTLLAALRSLVNRLTGVDPDAIDIHQSWFEAGVDSLLLIQFNQALTETWNVHIPLAQLLEAHTTLDRVAAYLDRQLPPDKHANPVAAATISTPQPAQLTESTSATGPIQADASDAVERVIAHQLQVMTQQLSLLSQSHATSAVQQPTARSQPDEPATAPRSEPQRQARDDASTPFVPYQPLETHSNVHLSEQQRRYLQDFVARYTTRTQRSKALAQQQRPVLADSRWTAGFRLAWKELIYPIMGQRSAGSHIWDVDGNEYIDFTMGFGVHLFGHSPRWLMDAIDEQLKLGVQLGPQSQLAGETAGLICELTGVERVTFCNSGTEAVMGALRVARAVTGRAKIVYFAGAYHGWSDATLARQIAVDGRRQSLPLAPGVPAQAVQDVLVLPYADPASLDVIRAQAHAIAAVLVEPVQSRRPDVQPRDFLHALRELTAQAGIALIFDEMVSGFRVAPGGAQAWFGVQADLVTYGKIVGGGFPIGVVAGKAAYMAAFDGGMWHYGDDSYPQAEKTLFAGAFFKHPLTMAAALAVLKHIKASGAALHDALNQRTASLAARLNSYFTAERLPLEVVYFSSLFRFNARAETQLLELFRYHLTHKGIHNWEGGNLFLSTAHSEADLEDLVQAVQATIDDLRRGGFLPQAPTGAPEPQILAFPLTDTQQARWIAAQIAGPETHIYNEPLNLRLRGPLDLPALHAAIQQVVDRHQALRTTFSAEGDQQRVLPALSAELPVIDLSRLEHQRRDQQVSALLAEHARQPFNLASGPLFRFLLVRLSEHEHIFLTTLHHLITDSWSGGIIFKEISAYYAAACQRQIVELPVPVQFSDYVTWLAQAQRQQTQAETYWRQRFVDGFPILELPTDHPRTALPSFRGARMTVMIDPELTQQIKQLARQQACSLLMVLLAGWNLLLHHVTGQHDLVVGVPVAGQLALPSPYLVGYCSPLLPLRSRLTPAQTGWSYLADVRRTVVEALDEQHYPFGKLGRQLSAGQPDRHIPLIRTLFNLEPRGSKLAFYGLDVQPIPHVHDVARYDIVLNVVELDDRLELACDYATDLFERRTIERWLQSFQTLLANMAHDPMVAVSHLLELLDLSNFSAEAAPTPPRTPIEQQIAAVWRELLSRQQVGVHDNFFACGGDSLLAVRLIVRLREIFHIDLTVRSCLEQPTIAAIAATIGAALASDSQAKAPATGDP